MDVVIGVKDLSCDIQFVFIMDSLIDFKGQGIRNVSNVT